MPTFLKNFSRKSSGFTLIELLVVVSIIGMLATVVLASLNSARSKGADAKIKSQLNSMRTQAQLYTGGGAWFNGLCNPTANTTLFGTANNGLGSLFNDLTLSKVYCYSRDGLPSAGAEWVVTGVLSTSLWCVDYTGVSRDKDASGIPYTFTGDPGDVMTPINPAGTPSCL